MEMPASILGLGGSDDGWVRKKPKRLAVIATLRLIAGSDRLRRSDCEIGAPLGVIKFTIAISRMAAPSKVINNTLGSFSHVKCSHKG